MRNTSLSLLSFAVAAALANTAIAQGDDCTGALSVTNGTSGPYTNVGATTSAPAWPCAGGGSDVWFSYLALGTGNLTADLCGSGYDTAIEVFDGTAGCGALVSLACNDDSCGLQSSATVAVNAGTTYYIRVGGWNSSTGTFSLNLNGPAGSGTPATVTPGGTGCVAKYASFHELFTTAANWDLDGVNMTLVSTGTGYVALPLGSYVAPTGAATTLTLTDDSETTTPNLTTPFPYVGGTATNLTVCSNGFVSVATGNTTDFSPSAAELLAAPQTSWRFWHDFNPAAAGSGQVKFEEVGSVAYITWDGVFSFGRTTGGSFMQMQFDCATGNVTFAFLTADPQGSTTNAAVQRLVGYSPGGASLDPGTRDISATLAGTFNLESTDLAPLAFAASARPVINTSINLNTSNITPTAPFGAVGIGLTNPGFDLTNFGMAGCTQYSDNLVTLLFLPLGSPTASVAFAVPSQPFAVGVTLHTQSYVYDPAAGLTALGAVSSNGLALFIGDV